MSLDKQYVIGYNPGLKLGRRSLFAANAVPRAETTASKLAGGGRPPRRAGLQNLRGGRKENSSKLKERSGNVYENKGPLWKTCPESRNVIENKGTYRLNPGMLLKIQDLFMR